MVGGREAGTRHRRRRVHRREPRAEARGRWVRDDAPHRAGLGLLAAGGARVGRPHRAARPRRRRRGFAGGGGGTPGLDLPSCRARRVLLANGLRGDPLPTNVVGTANLLEAGRQAEVEAFVNTGSSSEYGLKEKLRHARTTPSSRTARTRSPRPRPRCSAATSPWRSSLNVCTLRLYWAYGPWEEPKRLVPALPWRAPRPLPTARRPPDRTRLRLGRRHRRRVPSRGESRAQRSRVPSTTS